MSDMTWEEAAIPEIQPRVMLISTGGSPVRINHAVIEDFPPFENIHLDFPSDLTVIAGANGVGKSRLLTALLRGVKNGYPPASAGTGTTAASGPGTVTLKLSHIAAILPLLVYLPALRQIEDTLVPAIYPSSFGRDILKEGAKGFKSWFINTDHYLSRGKYVEPATRRNFKTVQRIFGLLDPSITYKEVDEELDIIVQTPRGPRKFELLSNGFQSAFKLLFEILSLIEGNNQGKLAMEDYSGIVLVDEIDVHLHPTWQGSILRHLKTLIPKAQIIVTTHSAHVIQGLQSEELIALELSPDGFPQLRKIQPRPGPFGFKGWTVEEILRDVMGLEDTTSPELQKAEEGFNAALDIEDPEAAKPYYDQLMVMLHPSNGMRKVYDLQFETIGGRGE